MRSPVLFFFKGVIPNYIEASVGAESLQIPWVVAGRGVGSQRKSQLVPLRGYGWRVLVALSVSGAERTSPGMASGLFACDKATQTEQSSSWAGWKRRREGKPAPDCSACKAPRGWEDGEDQKIVVSYLVLIPLLASCPGSTIHGRLARVFCSDGSICFKRERLMPVMWYLYEGASMHPNTAWGPTLLLVGLQGCWL